MAKKENSVLAVDVGSSSLKMAEFFFSESGAMVLEKFAFREFDDRDADPAAAFADAYRRMLAEHQFRSRRVCLSISGQTSFTRLSKLPPLSGNLSAVAHIVEFEAKQIVPYPMNEVVWGYQLISHVQTIEHAVEAANPGEEPQVEVEESEDFEALFVAVKNDQVAMFTDPILNSGKEVLSVDVAPIAMFNAAKASQCSGDECTLLLNIGGRCTNLVIVDSGRVFVRSIPIAGDTVTQQISREFGVGFQEAENLKRRHGFVALGGAYEEPDSELAATISKIVRNIMTRLHGEINRSVNVWRSQHGGNAPVRLLLAGGGSLMYYTQEFFHEKLHMPVDYLNVFSMVTLGEEIDRQQLLDVAPMFSELTGTALRQVTDCPVDISLIPQSIRFQRNFRAKRPYFYASAVSVVLCLLLFLLAVMQRKQYSSTLVNAVSGGVQQTQAMQDRIKSLESDLNRERAAYEKAAGFFRDREKWVGMLQELQQIMPDMMFLAALEGEGTAIEPPKEQSSGGSDLFPMEMMAPAPQGPSRQDASLAAGAKAYVRKEAEKLSDVKELRLKFYTLKLDEGRLLEDEFRKALKNSKYFSDADDAFVIQEYEGGHGVDNLNSFTALVKLKEPIRK